jgi:hypothetical protein
MQLNESPNEEGVIDDPNGQWAFNELPIRDAGPSPKKA